MQIKNYIGFLVMFLSIVVSDVAFDLSMTDLFMKGDYVTLFYFASILGIIGWLTDRLITGESTEVDKESSAEESEK